MERGIGQMRLRNSYFKTLYDPQCSENAATGWFEAILLTSLNARLGKDFSSSKSGVTTVISNFYAPAFFYDYLIGIKLHP
jgi:hypothetical protein